MSSLITADSSSLAKFLDSKLTDKSDYELVEIAQTNPSMKKAVSGVLCIRHLALLKSQAKRNNHRRTLEEDGIQASLLGMLKAIDGFDLNNPKQVKFTTYAFWDIRKSVQNWSAKEAKKDVVYLSDKSGMDLSYKVSHYGNFDETQFDVEKAMTEVLDEDEKKVVGSYFWKGMTYSGISEELGIPPRKVSTIMNKARKKLKQELKNYDPSL